MALADIIDKTRQILYGAGLGEKPALVFGAADALESLSGPFVSFDLATGLGGKAGPGDILSVRTPVSAAAAFVLYVTGVSTDTVTAVNGYEGEAVADGDLDNAVLEVNAPSSYNGLALLRHVETVLGNLIYPHIFRLDNEAVTASITTGEAEVPATVEKIRDAMQVIASETWRIPFELQKNLPATISSTGKLATLGVYDTSVVHLIVEEKYLTSDTDIPAEVESIIAIGAAALAAGGDVTAANMERGSKESQKRGERDVSASLWRDFLTLRQSKSEELAEDVEYFEIIR